MRGALQRGQPACLVTPSHLNVAGWRSLRHRPAMPRNFRVPPSWAPPQPGCLSLICPGAAARRSAQRQDSHWWWPRGQQSGSSGRGVRGGAPTLHWSSLHPCRVLQRCCRGLPVRMGSGEKETPSLLLPLTHLGIFNSATGKRTAGVTVLLGPKRGPWSGQRAHVMQRMVVKYGNQVYCFQSECRAAELQTRFLSDQELPWAQ